MPEQLLWFGDRTQEQQRWVHGSQGAAWPEGGVSNALSPTELLLPYFSPQRAKLLARSIPESGQGLKAFPNSNLSSMETSGSAVSAGLFFPKSLLF